MLCGGGWGYGEDEYDDVLYFWENFFRLLIYLF